MEHPPHTVKLNCAFPFTTGSYDYSIHSLPRLLSKQNDRHCQGILQTQLKYENHLPTARIKCENCHANKHDRMAYF
jgi:hypothetical protein